MTHAVLQDVSGDDSTRHDERRHEAQSTFDRLFREYFWITSNCPKLEGKLARNIPTPALDRCWGYTPPRLVDCGCLVA
jgi:hypothetical protein